MRKISFFIAGIILLIFLFTAFTFFLPSRVTVSKSISINASSPGVFYQIEDFDNWKNWFPAFMDKSVTVTVFHNQHDSSTSAELTDNSGRKLIFKRSHHQNNRIDIELYTKEKTATNYQFILIPGNAGNTEVVWNITTILGWYPWKKLQGIVMDKLTGPQYVLALQQLKKVVESKSVPGHAE